LAYIGGDGNIYITTPELTSPIAVTHDATTSPENMGFSYHRISWSPDGQLAFASVTRSLTETYSQLYVTADPGTPARLVAQNKTHFMIYIYWAPAPCASAPGCRRLAYLVEVEDDQIGLHLVEMTEDQVEDRLIGRGQPFYFSWKSDGQGMAWHTGGAHRYNSEAQLALYDIEQEQLDILPQAPGLFFSPAWSPQGQENWLGVIAQESADQLHHFKLDQPVKLIADTDNFIAFAWSPAGDQVAYAIRRSSTDPTYGPLHVFNLATGQSKTITEASFRVASFFWSPDGHKIGYLARLSLVADWLQWRVYDLETGQDRGYNAFTPSYQTEYVMSSFPQYAQSDRFWSPDSRYLVYADRDKSQVERVWLVDTLAEKGAPPLLVGEGTFGIWSWK
jgi:Tol biopolymer transport system component